MNRLSFVTLKRWLVILHPSELLLFKKCCLTQIRSVLHSFHCFLSRDPISAERREGKRSDPASFFPSHGMHFSSLRSLAISLSFPSANLTVFHFFPTRCFSLILYLLYRIYSGWSRPPHPSIITSPLSHAVFPSLLLSFLLPPSLLSTTKRLVRDSESMHRSNCSR